MKRSAFPPSPFPAELPEVAVHPAPWLLSFILLSLVIGLAWTGRGLALAAAAVLFFLLWPRPGWRPLRALLLFVPLLVLGILMHLFPWRGFAAEGHLPFAYDSGAWPRGLAAALRMGLWILISARSLERLHPTAIMARLPEDPALARRFLAPVLALSWLAFTIREAWLLERAWRARAGRHRWPHWPALLLPLFRNLLARSETLSEALALRRFPLRWAGCPAPGLAPGDLVPVLVALLALAGVLAAGRG